MDDTFSGADFSAAASATASPDSSAGETAQPTGTPTAPTAETASTDTAATGQAAAAIPVSEQQKSVQGVPPEKHWPTILDNARKKGSEEALAQWRQQHGWAEHLDRAAYDEAARIGQMWTNTPDQLVPALVQEIRQQRPELLPALRSALARELGAGAREAQSPTFEPDIPVYDDRGQLVAQTFSAQKVQDLVKHAVAEALGQEVTPIKERIRQADEAARAREQQQQMASYVDDTYETACKELPLFQEHDNEIAQVMSTLPPGIHPERAMWLGWAKVVLPKLSTAERKKVLADINQKPAASTVSPSSGTTAVPKPDSDKDWTELLEEKAPQFLGR